MKTVEHAGSRALLLVLVVAALHGVLGDELFFHSDPLSLVVYASCCALLGSLLLLPFGVVTRVLPARTRRAGEALATTVLLAALLTATFRLGLGLLVRRPLVSGLTVACAAVALALAAACCRQSAIRHRLRRLGALGFACVFVFTPSYVTWSHLRPRRSAGGAERHLVLVVLDGFPAQYLSHYDPRMEPTSLDALLDQATLFRQVQTALPYTYGFFGQLYSGRDTMRLAGDGMVRVRDEERPTNLLQKLQRAGVATRWVSWDGNGIPESSAAHTADYRGLRSYFLTERYAWIPRLMGLDYHVALASVQRYGVMRGGLGKSLHRRLNRVSPPRNALTDWLLPELRQLRSRSARTFTLFHIGWTDAALDPALRGDLAAQRGPPSAPNTALIARMQANDDRYGADAEAFAAEVQASKIAGVRSVGDSFVELLAALRSESLSTDTTILVTADHGAIFGKGRFWYGFHPNQEVLNVLCAVLNAHPPRTDRRLFTTKDLTASLLDHFGLPALDADARSLFLAGPGRTHVATLADRASEEWWLAIAREHERYWCNLHPSGRGELRAYRADTFDEVALAADGDPDLDSIPDAILPVIAETLRKFDLTPDAIHPRFRAAVESAGTPR